MIEANGPATTVRSEGEHVVFDFGYLGKFVYSPIDAEAIRVALVAALPSAQDAVKAGRAARMDALKVELAALEDDIARDR